MDKSEIEKATFSNQLAAFITKFRLPILGVLGVLIMSAVVLGIVFAVTEAQTEKGLTTLDELALRLESLDIMSDSFASDQAVILAEAKELAKSTGGVVSVRSFLFVANSEFEAEQWADAKDSFLSAYEADKKAYTAPIALYNVATCSEELGEYDEAITYLTMASGYENFPLASRALFNIGRIEEISGNYQNAANMYQKLNDSFPNTQWANLAKSRLLSLQAEQKAE
ncbi:MAG: tetratricopeptide repeat protein [Spirochaetales bacterium]